MVIEPAACILGALLLLTVPLRFLLAAALAASVHELCHFLALRACDCHVMGLRIGPGGVLMETEPLSAGKELVCALAGPVGSLLLTAAFPLLPHTALCGLVQGLFNLLPVYPLDGGRTLSAAAMLLLGPFRGKRLFLLAERVVLTSLFFLGVTASIVLRWGVLPVFTAATVILRAISRKIPCKQTQVGVQ